MAVNSPPKQRFIGRHTFQLPLASSLYDSGGRRGVNRADGPA